MVRLIGSLRIVWATLMLAAGVAGCNRDSGTDSDTDTSETNTSPSSAPTSDEQETSVPAAPGTLAIVMGPSSASSAPLTSDSFGIEGSAPADGGWALSPNEMDLTLVEVQLGGGNMAFATVNCSIHYDLDEVGLSSLSDCPFDVPLGTYTDITLGFRVTYDVLINDPANGFFSTPAGIVTAAPASGAEKMSVTLDATNRAPGINDITVKFPHPLTVTDTTPVSLSLVVNGLQFFTVNVTAGKVDLDGAAGTGLRPDVIASIGSIAKVAFYSDTGTAGSVQKTGTSVNVYYASESTPSMLGVTGNGNGPDKCNIGVGFINNGTGYIGLDSTGILGWAQPTNDTWTSYSSVFAMAEVSTIGTTTTLYCKDVTADPAPVGGSFASGAPDITTDAYRRATLTLLAK